MEDRMNRDDVCIVESRTEVCTLATMDGLEDTWRIICNFFMFKRSDIIPLLLVCKQLYQQTILADVYLAVSLKRKSPVLLPSLQYISSSVGASVLNRYLRGSTIDHAKFEMIAERPDAEEYYLEVMKGFRWNIDSIINSETMKRFNRIINIATRLRSLWLTLDAPCTIDSSLLAELRDLGPYTNCGYISDVHRRNSGYTLAWMCLQRVQYHHDKNEEMILQAVRVSAQVIKYVDPKEITYQLAMNLVMDDGDSLQYLKTFQNNRNIVFTAILTGAYALQFASKSLQNDHSLVLEAVRNQGMALQFASEQLQNNKEIVLTAVRSNPLALKFASNSLKDDMEVVVEAVSRKPIVLSFASEASKKNKTLVQIATRQDGRALEYASEELRNNKQLVLEVVQREPLAYNFVSESLSSDPDIQRAAGIESTKRDTLCTLQ